MLPVILNLREGGPSEVLHTSNGLDPQQPPGMVACEVHSVKHPDSVEVVGG